MERNESSIGQGHTPFKKRPVPRDILADFSSCFRLVDKENGLSSAEKPGEDPSLESERPSFPFGTPNSLADKINHFSPRRTTCEKTRELAESPVYVWNRKSSGKKLLHAGLTPASIFQDSNKKRPEFLDFRPPSAAKPHGLQSDKPEFVLPELERQSFALNMFESVWSGKDLPGGNFASFNVFLNEESATGGASVASREPRGRAEPGKCNCRNSQCLKMYCDCLKRGEFCVGCNCVGCENHADSQIRPKKLGNLSEKSKKTPTGAVAGAPEDLRARVARNGCNCRKNACLKKYCECHQFGLRCGRACRCLTCQNGREDPAN